MFKSEISSNISL